MKQRNIILTASAIAACFIVLLVIAARAYDAASQRNVYFRYLHEALEQHEAAILPTDWRPAEQALTRTLSTADRDVIERRLSAAWMAYGAAQDSGDTAILSEWFHDVALTRATRAAASACKDGTRMVVLHQSLRPEFYHLDGSLLQLDAELLVLRFAAADQTLEHYELTRDTVRITMLRRNTGWYIISHERRDSQLAEPRPAAELATGPLAGVNYYPGKTPWRAFWPNYDAETTRRDLALISGLGANALRIFLPEEDFAPGPALAGNLASLADLLAQAKAQGLHVIPTLFDLRDTYGLAQWTGDLAYLDAVLPVLAASSAVALIDVKNEPDLDFTLQGRATVLTWLRTMTARIRQTLPDMPLTIGWAEAGTAHNLARHLDVVSYHDYAEIEAAAQRLERVRLEAGARPVLVTETGVSAWSVGVRFPSSPEKQARTLAQRLDSLAPADGLFIWTLHDFPEPDSRAIGTSPWIRGLQAHFGLFDAEGTPRPAAAIVREAFNRLTDGAQ